LNAISANSKTLASFISSLNDVPDFTQESKNSINILFTNHRK